MFYLISSLASYFQHRSIIALIFANVLPLYGVYYLGWSISQIVILYWSENVIIGFFNVLKMLYNTNENMGEIKVNGQSLKQGTLAAAKVFMIPFFIMHYGMFTFVHGVFVFVYFVFGIKNGEAFSWDDAGYLFLNILMIFISHGMSFMLNYIGKDERSKVNIAALMFSPYVRIVAMQLVVIFGGMVYMSTGRNDASLAILIIAKIIADIFSHMKQHAFLPGHKLPHIAK